MEESLLPGVPGNLVRAALEKAGGNEIASGKFASDQSSAALAVNAFGWFLERPHLLPPFPCLPDCDWPPSGVSVEREMRFPWAGGRHPWLDAVVETPSLLIGIESKRYEPFRSTKPAILAEAYDRDVWGAGMEPWTAMRDRLRSAPTSFRHLDAAQLVKHAFGLVTQARLAGKAPVLLYLFAEPPALPSDSFDSHRREISEFADQVAESAVRFASCSYREWLDGVTGEAGEHAARVLERFNP